MAPKKRGHGGISAEMQRELDRANPSIRSNWKTSEERAASRRFLPKAKAKPSTPDPVRQRILSRDLQVGDGGAPVDTLGIQRKAYAFYAWAFGHGNIVDESNWWIGAHMHGYTRPIEQELFFAACKTIELDLLDRKSRTDFKFRQFDFHMKVYETDPYRGQVSKNKQPIRFRILGKPGTRNPAQGKGRAEPRYSTRAPANRAAALQKVAAATLSVLRTQTVPGPAGQQSGLPEQRGQAH